MKGQVFEVSEQEKFLGLAWFFKHPCPKKINTKKNQRSISWIFTETGIGVAVEVACSCGKKSDVTNYGSW